MIELHAMALSSNDLRYLVILRIIGRKPTQQHAVRWTKIEVACLWCLKKSEEKNKTKQPGFLTLDS